jgi:Dyp-type peroxidase family
MFAKGVLPDTVIRDPRAEGLLVLATLDPALEPAGVRAWLTQVEALIRRLIAPLNGVPVARVAVALGRSFFFAGEAARFGLDERAPLGLREPPTFEAEDRLQDSDVLFYLMTTSEAVSVEFLDGLSQTRPIGLRRLEVERGFQRADAREMFGFLDGLRNVPFHERFRTVFVNREVTADEPAWTEDGTYLAYMKIEQDLDLWRSISLEEQEQIIGRRKGDGSRLDLPPATKARSEPDFGSGVPSPGSHVRKVGPRGEHADLKIFRRGGALFQRAPGWDTGRRPALRQLSGLARPIRHDHEPLDDKPGLSARLRSGRRAVRA